MRRLSSADKYCSNGLGVSSCPSSFPIEQKKNITTGSPTAKEASAQFYAAFNDSYLILLHCHNDVALQHETVAREQDST
jgi:hypothetical protein